MDFIGNLASGFGVALSFKNLIYAGLGAILGTAVGVLPGLGTAATIALLLPLTFKLEPISAVIMLAGIYYGAQYGGSTTSILLNIPGEAGSIVTCLDGYQMARKGRAGAALGCRPLDLFRWDSKCLWPVNHCSIHSFLCSEVWSSGIFLFDSAWIDDGNLFVGGVYFKRPYRGCSRADSWNHWA